MQALQSVDDEMQKYMQEAKASAVREKQLTERLQAVQARLASIEATSAAAMSKFNECSQEPSQAEATLTQERNALLAYANVRCVLSRDCSP